MVSLLHTSLSELCSSCILSDVQAIVSNSRVLFVVTVYLHEPKIHNSIIFIYLANFAHLKL